MKTLDLETIIDWLRNRGGGSYAGEPVTQLSHALQCATLAARDDASPELVTAALLHDICHLADNADDRLQPHETQAARMLEGLFAPAVIEPIRLHVAAKRYLCAVDPSYREGLSEMSKRSLEWQGGPFSMEEAAAFIDLPYAADAVALRRWDDAAKIPDAPTFPLEHFVTVMWSQALETLEQA